MSWAKARELFEMGGNPLEFWGLTIEQCITYRTVLYNGRRRVGEE